MNITFLALSKILGELAEDLELRAYHKKPKFNCAITEAEANVIMRDIARLNNDSLSKEQACKFLNMSRATFDRKILEGTIPKGKKTCGWKELSWSKMDLEDLIANKKKRF